VRHFCASPLSSRGFPQPRQAGIGKLIDLLDLPIPGTLVDAQHNRRPGLKDCTPMWTGVQRALISLSRSCRLLDVDLWGPRRGSRRPRALACCCAGAGCLIEPLTTRWLNLALRRYPHSRPFTQGQAAETSSNRTETPRTSFAAVQNVMASEAFGNGRRLFECCGLFCPVDIAERVARVTTGLLPAIAECFTPHSEAPAGCCTQ